MGVIMIVIIMIVSAIGANRDKSNNNEIIMYGSNNVSDGWVRSVLSVAPQTTNLKNKISHF